MTEIFSLDATAIAGEVRRKRVSACEVTRTALERADGLNPRLNCFSAIFHDAAMSAASEIDRKIDRGIDPGPLAGVPFGVKNLFNVKGVTTLVGSKILQEAPAEKQDATAVARLKDAGAILIGANHMDEFAYGFTTQNAHYGPTRNPHDLDHSAGGSSGGSAASVAAHVVPLNLGSDTNGSIRVPAAFCGIFGLKPTLRRLSRAGAYPFVPELDHVGPFARSVRDLALAYDLIQGPDPADPFCLQRPVEPTLPTLERPVQALRAALLGGWFQDGADPEILAVTDEVASALGARQTVSLTGVAEARAAAFCLTAASGAALHLDHLRTRPQHFDPATRDRFFAGALLPASVIHRVRQIRLAFRDHLRAIFQDFDVLIAPVAPTSAPRLDQTTLKLGDREVPLRPNVGLYTQPLSFIGLPIVTVPVNRTNGLPIGVQVIAAAWREDTALRVAAQLERDGIAKSPIPAFLREGG
ncbi:MAG: atzE [Rhodospirillales bacterium]|nr:atzE [Rhodospirillales bacterium]